MADKPERYCICRKPYDSSQFMIACDSCGEWFHGSCVGIQEHQASDIERYHCPNCSSVHGPLTLKKRRNWHRHDYSEIDDGSKAVQTGTVLFINNLKNKKFASSKDVLVKAQGKDLTLEYFEKNGFSKPVCVDKKDGLGLVVPSEDFSIMDVEKHIGSMKELDVIDVNKQEDIKMVMREWTEYYMNPIKKKTLNVISLEFSKTGLSPLVQIPTVVRDMDWVNHAWPTDLPEDSPHKRPYVQKYCLMSVKNCYTDFHVDFGGTSVWYHVLRGEKVFYFVEPTPTNLEQYHKWVISPSQSEVFFGNMVNKCYKVNIKQGQTLFIPTGWIHGVFTPTDSLVFGGNFLHSFNIGLQLEIYDLEIKLKTPTKFQHPFYETVNWYAAIYLLDKLKGFLENGNKVPQYITKGLRALADKLKEWSTKGEEFVKYHKFFIPDGVQPGKLIRSLNKELKKAEKSKTSRPSTPKFDELPKTTVKLTPSVTIDASNRITIKNLALDTQGPSKRTLKKDQNSNEEKGYSCQVDESKPIIRIANPGGFQGDSLDTQEDSCTEYQGDSLSKSMPSLKLKIPRRQESLEKLEPSYSTSVDSSLKLVVSNGKIVRSNRSSVEMSNSSRQFQPLAGDSMDTEGQYSCTTTNKQPLKLKLSMSSAGFTAQDNQILPNDSDLDFSDDELGFSLGGTPQFMNTSASIETTQGLQSTSTEARLQPVAQMESKDRDLKAEIEAAKTLLFGFSSFKDSKIQSHIIQSIHTQQTKQPLIQYEAHRKQN
ncbi:lysine-specific demethylase 7B-like [Actinia tenebrosa]|uniref:Lysine-specific demethylase 7B-like n=1 Tax=Actinia tenebrosa TaxID=6105 RepID=A0A6P8INE7_ACTTE|nr:lysine-specific demethylase 7B-like [Actinia tenebrosa]